MCSHILEVLYEAPHFFYIGECGQAVNRHQRLHVFQRHAANDCTFNPAFVVQQAVDDAVYCIFELEQ